VWASPCLRLKCLCVQVQAEVNETCSYKLVVDDTIIEIFY
jgi:hypothetical protein